jgi:hypothetical protein
VKFTLSARIGIMNFGSLIRLATIPPIASSFLTPGLLAFSVKTTTCLTASCRSIRSLSLQKSSPPRRRFLSTQTR